MVALSDYIFAKTDLNQLLFNITQSIMRHFTSSTSIIIRRYAKQPHKVIQNANLTQSALSMNNDNALCVLSFFEW